MQATGKYGRVTTSLLLRLTVTVFSLVVVDCSHEKQMKLAEELASKGTGEQGGCRRSGRAGTCAEPIVRRDNSETVKTAVEASEMYGKTSKEARMSWELVAELDAANSHHRANNILASKEDDECSTDSFQFLS